MDEKEFNEIADKAQRELRPAEINAILDEAAKTGRIEIELEIDLEGSNDE